MVRVRGSVGEPGALPARRDGRAVAGLAVAAAAVLVVLLTLVLLRRGNPFGADALVRRLLGIEPSPLARFVTQLGAGPVLYPLMCLLALLRWRRWPDHGWSWSLLPIGALAAEQVLEGVLFVTIPRPSPGPATAASSFSSGHAAAATLAWALVAAHTVAARRGHAPRLSMSTAAVGVVAGLVVGACGVRLGFHWATDVAGAVSFGVLVLAAAAVIDRRLVAVRAGSPRPRTHSARLVWLWAVPAAAALAVVAAGLFAPGAERFKDLLVYRGAGGAGGAGSDVYGFRSAFDMPFTYPPFAALLAEPLSRMPIGLGQALWTLATLAAAGALAATALRPVVARLGLPLATALLLVSSPMRSHVRFGQVGVFLALAVALDLLREPTGRRRGLGLGIAIAVKLTPAVFLPWLFFAGQRTRLRATVAWVAGASAVGLLLLWPSASHYVWHASTDTARFGANDIPGNQSVRGMLLRAGIPDGVVQPVWIALSLLLVVIATRGALWLERDGQRLAAVGVLASLSVAISPISWVHHLVWLVFPISALVAAGRYRTALAWYLLLLPGLPALAAAASESGHGPAFLWALTGDAQGLTAVAAVIALPALCRASNRSPTVVADGIPHPSARVARTATPASQPMVLGDPPPSAGAAPLQRQRQDLGQGVVDGVGDEQRTRRI